MLTAPGWQGIMLGLREKAHASLAQFRNTPPARAGTLSEPTTPADDNDELSKLGGRTRLVASKEKSLSPVIGELSPTSLNPIVPFPIKQDLDAPHPMVLEYLRTFPSHHQPQPPQYSFSDQPTFSDIPPGMPSSSSGYGPYTGPMPMEGTMPTQPLPQYFPVFDYGYAGGGEMLGGVSPDGAESTRSYSPETSMQTAWQDFVAQIGG